MTLLSVISLKTSEDIIIKPLFACKTSKKQKYASSSGYVKSNNVPQILPNSPNLHDENCMADIKENLFYKIMGVKKLRE